MSKFNFIVCVRILSNRLYDCVLKSQIILVDKMRGDALELYSEPERSPLAHTESAPRPLYSGPSISVAGDYGADGRS